MARNVARIMARNLESNLTRNTVMIPSVEYQDEVHISKRRILRPKTCLPTDEVVGRNNVDFGRPHQAQAVDDTLVPPGLWFHHPPTKTKTAWHEMLA